MIFMRMGEQQADDIRALLLKEADVGKDNVDARLLVAAKGDAHVDDEPLAVALAAIAVEIEIHADLANAAERHEDEFGLSVRFSRHVAAARPHRLEKKTSPAVTRYSPPPGISSLRAPSASRPPYTPSAS